MIRRGPQHGEGGAWVAGAVYGRDGRVARLLRWGRWTARDTIDVARRWRPPERPDPVAESVTRRAPAKSPEPLWGRTAPAQVARDVVQRGVLFPVLSALGRPEVTGVENLLAAHPPFIIAPNHASHADAPLVLQALPPWLRERTLVPAAKDYFFDRRWLSVFVMLAMNAVPFDRKQDIADSVRRCERLLRHGYSMVLFPEGSRSTDGRLRGFRSGVAHLAVQTGAPVIPVYVQGTHGLLPRGKRLPRPSALAVHFGAPLAAGAEETARGFNARLEETVTALGVDARDWGWRERPARNPSWRERWQRDNARGAQGGTGGDPSVPAATWIDRWRSTTPR